MTGTNTDGLQAAATEAYRRNPYPPMIHVRNTPDRFATIGWLAGMDPPDVRTARVLEVGVGNGLNQMALAQAFPDARFVGFDIEAEAIAQGETMRRAAGIDNLRLEVLDLLDPDGRIEGPYDYIIAHGVFAWVPPAVAEALLALIGRHLAPQGVAMISFNALPGCYVRLAMRDIMLRAAAGATTPEERVERAHAALAVLAEPRKGDSAIQRGFRDAAQTMLKGDTRVLIHDEMGSDYHPRHLADVLEQARPHGLVFLGDPTAERLRQAFVDDGETATDIQAMVERRACDIDDGEFCQFRRLLLIRAEDVPARKLTLSAINALYASSIATEDTPGKFANRGDKVDIVNPELAKLVRKLMDAYPRRVRVADLGLTAEMAQALVALFDLNIVYLHTVDAPYAIAAGDNPRTSPLARVMIGMDAGSVATLAHFPMILEPSVEQAVLALDGTGGMDRFDAIIAEAGVSREAALHNLAMLGLLMPDR